MKPERAARLYLLMCGTVAVSEWAEEPHLEAAVAAYVADQALPTETHRIVAEGALLQHIRTTREGGGATA